VSVIIEFIRQKSTCQLLQVTTGFQWTAHSSGLIVILAISIEKHSIVDRRA